MKEFIIKRTFDAPKELLYDCFTNTERLKHWWGPKGTKMLAQSMDFRVGGTYLYHITHDKLDIWGKMLYKEIHKPSKLVWVNSFSDAHGGLTRHPLSENWPLELLTTVTFEEHDGKTTVTVHWLPLHATPEETKVFESSFEDMNQGWGGSFEQLKEYLENNG